MWRNIYAWILFWHSILLKLFVSFSHIVDINVGWWTVIDSENDFASMRIYLVLSNCTIFLSKDEIVELTVKPSIWSNNEDIGNRCANILQVNELPKWFSRWTNLNSTGIARIDVSLRYGRSNKSIRKNEEPTKKHDIVRSCVFSTLIIISLNMFNYNNNYFYQEGMLSSSP